MIHSAKDEPCGTRAAKELVVELSDVSSIAKMNYRYDEYALQEIVGPGEPQLLLEQAIESIKQHKPKSVFVIRDGVRYRITNSTVRQLLDGTMTAADLAD